MTVAAASPTLGKGSAPVPAVVDTLDNWASDRIVMPGESVWRSGYYLNMAFQAISTATPKKFYVYVDEKTVDSEYPELHVVFKSGNSSSMYNFAFYASYNIMRPVEPSGRERRQGILLQRRSYDALLRNHRQDK